MSEFSELLSSYIEEKEVKVYSLLDYCNLDRSTMYKIINGKRNPPSEAVFQKITEFLHLTPVEYRRFKEAYLISRIGRELYYKRKYTENYLVSFPKSFSAEPVLFMDDSQKTEDSAPQDLPESTSEISKCSVVSSHLELNRLLYYMISEEVKKARGKVALLLQPDYSFLFNMLSSLKPGNNLKIEHTFCMSKQNQMTERNELCNLSYLNKILPLYFASLDYRPYYFYEDLAAHAHSFNGLSCMILTSEYAVTFTSDYTMGIFYHEPSVVSMLWSLYDSYQDKCQPLIHALDYFIENTTEFINTEFYNTSPNYVLQPEACLVPFISGSLLEKALVPDFPDRKKSIANIKKLLKGNLSAIEGGQVHVYFTKQGIADFAKSGRINEIPESFYRPLTTEERISLLKKILPYCRKEYYRLLKKPLNHLSRNLHLCTNSTSGYLLFNNIHNHTICLLINESSILTTFTDYLSSLDDEQLYTGEEAELFIRDIIEQLKKSLCAD